MSELISASHLDLLAGPVPAVLSTLTADGTPQSSLIRCEFDGEALRISLPCYSRDALNIQADPRVGLLIVDPADTARYIEVRGRAERVQTGPCLTARVYAERITLDAIHK
jgi:hypothetical protein